MKELKNVITIDPGAALKTEIEAPNGVYVKACRNFVKELGNGGFNITGWTTDFQGTKIDLLQLLGVHATA